MHILYIQEISPLSRTFFKEKLKSLTLKPKAPELLH
jgi:hypothetical protein